MAQALIAKHDLKGQHKSSGKRKEAAHVPRASMKDNMMWNIFFPEVGRAFSFDTYYFLVKSEICKGFIYSSFLPNYPPHFSLI